MTSDHPLYDQMEKQREEDAKQTQKGNNEHVDHDRISIVRQNGEKGQPPVPLWLITFTDVMALMLTFFVLLYSMSSPKEENWERMTSSLSGQFDKQYSKPFHSGPQDVINIDRIVTTRALDLNYLETYLTNVLQKQGLDNVQVKKYGERLIIALPSTLLFDVGGTDVKLGGKKALFAMGEVLGRIKNRIEIVGHTDPTPINNPRATYRSNWELSLARASEVAMLLRETGYGRNVVVRGLSSGLYDELPEEMEEQSKMIYSRRVDIVIMEDDGAQKEFLTVQ